MITTFGRTRPCIFDWKGVLLSYEIRPFFSFLTLWLLVCTVASAHDTTLTLRQDDARNTQAPLPKQ
jgi:hypothetical protein